MGCDGALRGVISLTPNPDGKLKCHHCGEDLGVAQIFSLSDVKDRGGFVLEHQSTEIGEDALEVLQQEGLLTE